MGSVLYVGQFSRPIAERDIITIHTREDVEAVPLGEVVRRWDYVAEVDEDMFPPSVLAPLRKLSDDLADEVVEILDLRTGQDALLAVLDHLNLEEPRSEVVRFWEAVNCEPPEGVTALPAMGEKGRRAEDFSPNEAMMRNDRYGKPELNEGQAVFWRYSGPIFAALLHFSLAGGFSSPNLAAVMNETNYLTSASLDATYRRLLETTLFVLDAMGDMRVGVGKGWKSAVRVRLLHAMVRRRIRLGRGKLKVYDQEVSGIPINQEDLCTVLGSFMVAPIWSMQRTGITLTTEELAAYQAAWRHVGYYLGIDVGLLKRYYGGSFSTASKSFASMAFDCFPSTRPEDGYLTPTYRIISAVANRPPRMSSVNYHLEYSRRLLGPSLSYALNLPRGNWKDRLAVEVDIYSSWGLIAFGRGYARLGRPGWDDERMQLFRKIIELLTVWQLGARRTTFAWRDEKTHAETLGEHEGEEPGIEMGRAVGLEVKRRWMWLLAEMVGVLAGCGVVAAGTAVVGYRMLI